MSSLRFCQGKELRDLFVELQPCLIKTRSMKYTAKIVYIAIRPLAGLLWRDKLVLTVKSEGVKSWGVEWLNRQRNMCELTSLWEENETGHLVQGLISRRTLR